METGRVLKKENLLLIQIQDDFDMSEALFLSDVYDDILSNNIEFEVKEFIPQEYIITGKNEPIPVLVMGKNIKDLDINSNEYVRNAINNKYYCAINKLNLYENKALLSESKFSLGYNFLNNVLDDYKEELFEKIFTSKQSLFKSFRIGDCLFIIPNREIMYFNSNEIKKADKDSDYYWVIKKTLLNKASFMKELRERRNDIRNYINNLLFSIGKNCLKEELIAVEYNTFIDRGIFIGFADKEMVKTHKEKNVIPFEISDGRIVEGNTVSFVKPEIKFLNEDEIELVIKERNEYLETKSKEIEKFTKIVDKLKELKEYTWYSLDPNSLKAWENDGVITWKIWVRSNCLNNDDGWYSLKDLEDLLNVTGKDFF